MPGFVWVRSEFLPHVKVFKYFEVLFIGEGKMEHESNSQIDVV